MDVYSFSMILYQLFEHQPPFAGTDPVDAARNAALYEHRPPLSQLKGRNEPFPVGPSNQSLWCLDTPTDLNSTSDLTNGRLTSSSALVHLTGTSNQDTSRTVPHLQETGRLLCLKVGS